MTDSLGCMQKDAQKVVRHMTLLVVELQPRIPQGPQPLSPSPGLASLGQKQRGILNLLQKQQQQ